MRRCAMTGARRVYLNVSWALSELPDVGRQRILEALADARADQAHGDLPKGVGPVQRALSPDRGASAVTANPQIRP